MSSLSNHPRGRRPGLDGLSVVLLVVFAFVAGLVAAMRFAPAPVAVGMFPEDIEASQTIERRYGPPRHSNAREESFIRDFFQDERNGVFVDVGASEWRKGSNTYLLEHDLGWSGLAIDVLPEYAEGYRQNRPRTNYITAFVDAVEGQPRTVYVPDEAHRQLTSFVRSSVNKFVPLTRELHVTSTTLDTLLESAKIAKVDFLNMDIELGEPNALKGFSIDRYRPRLVCIEQHPPVRQAILAYFARHGYVVVGKYLPLDSDNLYFTPAGPSVSAR